MTNVILLLSLLLPGALAFAPHAFVVRPATRPLYNDFFGEEAVEEEQEQQESADGKLTNDELEAMAPEWGSHVPKFSRVTLVGRIGNDPDPRYFDTGKVVLNLSLAVRRKYHPLERRALKIQEDETDWFNLELWGRDAEYAAKYVTKGARVGVSGTLAVDSWLSKEGDKRRKATIIVKDLDILESKAEAELRRGNQQQYQGGNQQQYQKNRSSQEDKPRRSFYEDDDDDDDDDASFSAGTGGFFDN